MGQVKGEWSDVVAVLLSKAREEELSKDDAFMFRSLAARCNFSNKDGPDLECAWKEICRGMSSPRSCDWMLLKKLARYLVQHKRIAIDFQFQNDADFVGGYSDSDCGGCKDTRKSTTGGRMSIGTYTLRSWSSTQNVVTTSIGKAKFFAVVRCVRGWLGLQGLLRDLGMPMNIWCFTNSSAARGVAMHSGIGQIQHLEMKTLWVQDQVDRRIVKINKDQRTS